MRLAYKEGNWHCIVDVAGFVIDEEERYIYAQDKKTNDFKIRFKLSQKDDIEIMKTNILFGGHIDLSSKELEIYDDFYKEYKSVKEYNNVETE